MSVVACVLSCADGRENKAKVLLQEAQTAIGKTDYDRALSLIDSLRKTCPKAIEERKSALILYQQAYEKKTEKLIQNLMSELDKVNDEVRKMETVSERHKSEGVATANELSALTTLRLRRDSIQAKFDAACATMRLVHKKIAEEKGK